MCVTYFTHYIECDSIYSYFQVREHLGECLKSLRHEHVATLKKLADTEQNLVDAINEKSSIKTNLDRQTEEFQKRDVTYRLIIFQNS